MRKLYSLLFAMMAIVATAQQAYYNGINFNLRGIALKQELAQLITATHTKTLSYSDVWGALKVTDLDPTNSSRVVLIYGYNPSSFGDDAYYNGVNNNGGNNGQWNREHTFAKSLGNPNLGKAGPGADAHHLRASDVNRNTSRGNLKFADGSGNSHNVGNGWYPGDEWKGDVARMMMYMYLRYGDQCIPTRVGIGSTDNTPDDMIDLFLRWNAEDPVSQLEIQRNEYLGDRSNRYAQGNRNPFIDNPYLATLIWGGPAAQDLWNLSNVDYTVKSNEIKVATQGSSILVQSAKALIQTVSIYSSNGQLNKVFNNASNQQNIEIKNNPKGVYFLKIEGDKIDETKKVVIK
ncbi:endonuclease [Faecalibacter sp. LW9]|uniref:endonuclease n=1 Tax=Faecalibacter sp. LW9 TaxID=3103144 RepID=UPI002AFEAD54|nr:endonuclease [Faecalibacter sp. LW9]